VFPDSDVTVDYLADHVWIVGSPRTVIEKLSALRERVGKFGCLLQVVYDHIDDHAGLSRLARGTG